MLLENFNKAELEAVVRMMRDPDFAQLINFVKKSATSLSNRAINTAGMESERIKGACLAIQELRDNLLSSRSNLDRYLDIDEFDQEMLDRDTISP